MASALRLEWNAVGGVEMLLFQGITAISTQKQFAWEMHLSRDRNTH